jgi:hypothetical protein
MAIKFLRAFLSLFATHSHYWGVPHPDDNKRLVQTCYECNGTRRVKVAL